MVEKSPIAPRMSEFEEGGVGVQKRYLMNVLPQYLFQGVWANMGK